MQYSTPSSFLRILSQYSTQSLLQSSARSRKQLLSAEMPLPSTAHSFSFSCGFFVRLSLSLPTLAAVHTASEPHLPQCTYFSFLFFASSNFSESRRHLILFVIFYLK